VKTSGGGDVDVPMCSWIADVPLDVDAVVAVFVLW